MAYVSSTRSLVKHLRDKIADLQSDVRTQSLLLTTYTERDWSWSREFVKLNELRSEAKFAELCALIIEGQHILDSNVHAIIHPTYEMMIYLHDACDAGTISERALVDAYHRYVLRINLWHPYPAKWDDVEVSFSDPNDFHFDERGILVSDVEQFTQPGGSVYHREHATRVRELETETIIEAIKQQDKRDRQVAPLLKGKSHGRPQ